MSPGAVDTTLLKALQKLLEECTDYLTNVRLRALSEGDLGTTHMVPHRIEMDNVFPIKQQPRRTPPLKYDEFERQVTNLIQQGKVKEFVKPLVFFSCGGNPKKRQSKAVCGLSPAEYIEGKGCPLLTAR